MCNKHYKQDHVDKIDHGSINFGLHINKGNQADSKETNGKTTIGDSLIIGKNRATKS